MKDDLRYAFSSGMVAAFERLNNTEAPTLQEMNIAFDKWFSDREEIFAIGPRKPPQKA